MSVVDVLVVGGGGREHALAWKLRQSPRCAALYAAPGNPGIGQAGECAAIPAGDLDRITQFAVERKIGLVVVGPEAPLAAGLADRLSQAGVPVFGPSAAAARIESSKAFARELMTRAGVPQPEYRCFTEAPGALDYLDGLHARGIESVVVKASGLAAGKGAVVCPDLDEARRAIHGMMVEGAFGSAGDEVVVEERLVGGEASLFVLTDGERAVPLAPAQDYKRALDGDRGPNTGGMGSYAPAPLMAGLVEEAMDSVVNPTLRGLREAGTPFRGCLYAGLMKTEAGLRVIEFNCRLGDPETQAVLPLLEDDLLELMLAVAHGRLEAGMARCRPERAVTVVLTSGGYPGAYENGKVIRGIEAAAGTEGVLVFHAGTAVRSGELVTAGGRVLNVTGLGATFAEAMDRAYAAAELIRFEGRQMRSDIAARVRETTC